MDWQKSLVFSIHDQFYARAEQIVQTLNERTNCKVQLFDFEDDSILRRDCRQLYSDQWNFCWHGSEYRFLHHHRSIVFPQRSYRF